MSIIVVCQSCRKSFKVSDKFAGKSGPCPNCKQTLKVPEKSEEVTIHAPEAFSGGGRSKSGKLVTKPIVRQNARLQPVTATLVAATALAVVLVAWVGGRLDVFHSWWYSTVGLLVISPPLVLAAYEVLRDDELEPYRGTELYVRVAACSLAYIALWGVFVVLSSRGLLMVENEVWNWALVLPGFVLVGGFAALGAFDLEFGDAMFHYGFYLLVTVVLRWIAGMKWVWDL